MPRKTSRKPRRRICFVTGSRAEFGLMRSVLQAIRKDKRLQLQIIATGMHLDSRHGKSLNRMKADGWQINAIVDWKNSNRPIATGQAIAGIAAALKKLKTDIVLVVGDRVEAFAAAAAAHLSDILVAHIHGGDRALGQMDDSLRHAITKLAHIHFPATTISAMRLERLGENPWRIHRVGSPGIDGIRQTAAPNSQIRKEFPTLKPKRYALVALHPIDGDESAEFERATAVLRGISSIGFDHVVILFPNNDPGSAGIIRCWQGLQNPRFIVRRDLARPMFLGLLRDAAMLTGNSSSGIIEAASFKTPVIDVGPRQLGRERCEDVRYVPYRSPAIAAVAREIWNNGRPQRGKSNNPYGGNKAGRNMVRILQRLKIEPWLLRKLIAY